MFYNVQSRKSMKQKLRVIEIVIQSLMCWLKSYRSRTVFVSDSKLFIRVGPRITGGKT